MRKKYLSALLFGALLVTSAGTFTSCKDYDDDINNLQEQITANADAIKKLQEMIGDGKFVTNIVAENNGLKITWNDDSSTVIENVINGEAQKGDVVSIDPETGEIKINNEGTGFFASKGEDEEEAKLPYVNEEGVLVLVDAEGKEVVTGIRVAPVTAIVHEDGSADITIVAPDGTSQTIKVPSAASMISSIEISSKSDNNKFTLFTQKFTFKGGNVLDDASKWKGPKKLPSTGDYIIGSTDVIDVRLNPVSVDATNVKFYLTNTLNNDLSPVVLNATAEDSDNPLTSTDINSRAANIGNGLWSLSMENTVVSKNDYKETGNNGVKTELDNAKNESYAYSINAEHSCRSLYGMTIDTEIAPVYRTLELIQNGVTYKITDKIKVGSPVKVKEGADKSLFDMYLEADESDIEVYGLTFDQENRTFTIGKNPDVSSIDAKFNLIVWTVDITGQVRKVSYPISLNTEISTPAEYPTIEHNVNKENTADNYFGIDLSIMKNALGDNLNAWMQNVDLSKTTYQYSDKVDGTYAFISSITSKPITPSLVTELTNTDDKVTSDRNKVAFVKFDIDNSKVNKLLSLDKTYYIKVTFKTSSSSILNSIVVPVEFSAPALSELFTPKSGYVVNNVLQTYFYKTTGSLKQIDLDEFFVTDGYVADATVSLDDKQNIGDTKKKSNQLAGTETTNSSSATNPIFSNASIRLNATLTKEEDDQLELGYGEDLIVNVSKDNFEGWAYSSDADKLYQFKMNIKSPVFEGTVKPATGNTIEISAFGAEGFNITDAMIKGYDYNNNTYNVVPDLLGDPSSKDVWFGNGVKKVTVSPDTQKYITGISIVAATADKDDNTKVAANGYINVKARSVSNDTPVEIYVTVTDDWGYAKKVPVSVTIKRNNQ